MRTSEVKDILMEFLESKGGRKYIGKREEEALRVALSCIVAMENIKKEYMMQWFDEYEVRG